MIIDLSISNFRSFQREALFSMVAEKGLNYHEENFQKVDNGKIAVLRTATILGANASGKSNLFRVMHALKWLISESTDQKEGQKIGPYEPYKLDPRANTSPINFEIEFIVPSGSRYRYDISYNRDRVISEKLYTYPTRQKALMFSRDANDTWETMKFGSALKGGARRFPFFPNSTYMARAGNDASAPASIREIVHYFRAIPILNAAATIKSSQYYDTDDKLKNIADLLLLSDTNIKKITREEVDSKTNIIFPEDTPQDIRDSIIAENRLKFSFWSDDKFGNPVAFEEKEISDGTLKLFRLMPIIIHSLSTGTPIFIDEIDGHLHTGIVTLLLKLFNDDEINQKSSQLIFTTHDTNILNSKEMRRDQIWFVTKIDGNSFLQAADSYNSKQVRADSPFEAFYMAGRFGAYPNLEFTKIRQTVLNAVRVSETL